MKCIVYTSNTMNFHLFLKIFDENIKCVENEKVIFDQN